jgi:hypothetical protein
MLSRFLTRGPVIGEAEIATFEGRCGFPLPSDYRQFLLDQNGGLRAPAPRTPKELAKFGTAFPHTFLSLGAAAPLEGLMEEVEKDPLAWPEEFELLRSDLDWVMINCRAAGWGAYPPELLPVAAVSIGDLLLRLEGPRAGEVLYLPDPDGYCEWHLSTVAGSFAELLRDFEDWDWA